ncbi:hypothetical protein C6W19_12375 [Bacillus sp. RJGP41]|nr:hypothetical protein C6W19_12375 [Bacillus sp. RJGP41]
MYGTKFTSKGVKLTSKSVKLTSKSMKLTSKSVKLTSKSMKFTSKSANPLKRVFFCLGSGVEAEDTVSLRLFSFFPRARHFYLIGV